MTTNREQWFLDRVGELVKLFRNKIILSLHDCDGMCNHCMDNIRNICSGNSSALEERDAFELTLNDKK